MPPKRIIIGDGVIPEAKAFYDVRDWLEVDCDVVLASHLAPLFNIEIKGQVIYNLEPLYDGCRSFQFGYLEILKNNIVLDYSSKNVEYLKMYGVDAFYLPYGYHKSLERPIKSNKDIDFLLVGSINERRAKVTFGLAQYGSFHWVQGVYGIELDRLISRANVLINCHYCEDHPLEVVRLNYLMANDCNIVSEFGNEDHINEIYANGVLFSTDIVGASKFAINNPKSSYETIKSFTINQTPASEWVRSKLCLG